MLSPATRGADSLHLTGVFSGPCWSHNTALRELLLLRLLFPLLTVPPADILYPPEKIRVLNGLISLYSPVLVNRIWKIGYLIILMVIGLTEKMLQQGTGANSVTLLDITGVMFSSQQTIVCTHPKKELLTSSQT